MAFKPKMKYLPRRSFLRGAGGAMLSLPILEVMGVYDSRLLAQATGSKKYLLALQGNSYCVDTERLPSSSIESDVNYVTPIREGANYDIRPGLGILNNYPELIPYTMVVSGLEVPNTGLASMAGRLPDGGYHEGSISPIILGDTTPDDNIRVHSGFPTSDVIVGRALKGGSPIESLGLGHAGDRLRANISQENNNNLTISDSQSAFDKVFPGLQQGADTAAMEIELARKKLILDTVLQEKNSLLNKVSANDKIVLDEYFTRVHETNQLIQNTAAVQCEPFDASSLSEANMPEFHQKLLAYRELIALGFQCDMFQAAAMQTSTGQSFMDINQILANNKYNFHQGADRDKIMPVSEAYHELGHYKGGPDQRFKVSAINCWALDHFFYVADKLRQIPTLDGNMLDNSALVFTWESGFDLRPSPGNPGTLRGYVHSSSNKIMLIIGGAGRLKKGQHIKTNKAHPAAVILTVMQQLGLDVQKFGQVESTVSEILT